jgi:hypothetical protein
MNKNKEKLFWRLHLTWWFVFMIYITIPIYKLPKGTATTLIIFYIIHYFLLVTITYVYRIIYNKLKLNDDNPTFFLITVLIGVCLTGTILFFLNAHGFIFYYESCENITITLEQRIDYLIDCIWNCLPWFMGYHLFRFARFSTQRESELLKSLQESELERLKKQLNPHFLFNALNGIKALILTEPLQSREAIGQLSDLLRLSLKTNLFDNIPLNEEMEILENYLSIEKIRFQNRLTIEFDIPKDLRKYQVLPFSLQILAENAVKHGIGKQKKGGIVKISAEKGDKNLILKVSNTGNLKPSLDVSNENTGIGLENLRKRLKINFGEKATFEIQELNNLVTAIILLPLEI